MTTIAIHNGRVIDPALGRDSIADVVIVDGRVARVGPNEGDMVVEAERIDATGLVVAPGFVDLHVHLREPGFEYKETIATGTLAAARGGFTTVCAMPNTMPPLDSRAAVESVLREAEASAHVRVLPIGCITHGRAGKELAPAGELAGAGVVALSDDGDAVADPSLMRHALEYSTRFGLPIAQHCEDPRLVGDGQMHEGWVATRLGLRGRPASAEETMVARDIALAELTGAHLHICHISTAGSVALVRAARERGTHVTAEVTPHHLTLTHEEVAFGRDYRQLLYDTNAKVNPPLREESDIEALVAALRDGVIDAIATDHAPHATMDKDIEFDLASPGISGLETAFGLSMRLVHSGDIDLAALIERLTAGPVRAWGLDRGRGLEGLGTLAPGAVGDVTLLDPDAEWVVEPSGFASSGKNTPLAGTTLRGRVAATVYGGAIVYQTERAAAL
ncbi:MAG: amidohydrolase family protein [Dehalococcoidia bacterium]|nr:amidohydrolase family protein [Dehalococcoidia bacterium]